MTTIPPLSRLGTLALQALTILLLQCAPIAAARAQRLQPAASSYASPAPLVTPVQWRGATRADLRAAHDLLAQNHPAALPELRDHGFMEALEKGYSDALRDAESVTSYEGYQAVLARYANGFRDQHVWSRPRYLPARLDWAGLLVARRGTSWIVSDEDPADPDHPLLGWRLLDCDGLAADEIGRQAIGAFSADWSVDAQRVQMAPWLLVSGGNPFAAKPKTCRFGSGQTIHTLDLQWRSIRRDVLIPRMAVLRGAGRAGFGVRRVGDGFWIGLQSLDAGAAAVVTQVESERAALRDAPFVVLDLRGNGGGGSLFGRQIAQALLGSDYVESRLGAAGDGGCDDVWRTSRGNVAQLNQLLADLGPTRGAQFVEAVTRLRDKAMAAEKAGKPLTRPAVCPAPAVRAVFGTGAARAMRGRLVLLTDNACFSACLAVTAEFLKLGALHIGQTTDACTNYTEVREITLPSGFSTFSTLQAVSPSAPARVGPFEPSAVYEGDIADTRNLEAWTTSLLQAKTLRIQSRSAG